MKIGIGCAIGLVLLPQHYLAAAGEPPARLIDGSFFEKVEPSEPVSGSAALGVVFSADDKITAVRNVTVKFLKPFGGVITLRIVTADGKYVGNAKYNIALKQAGETTLLPFPTASERLLTSYKLRNVAMSAFAGTGPERRYFPIVSNTMKPTSALIFISSQGADVFFRNTAQHRLTPCAAVEQIHGVQFDTVCDVPIGLINPQQPIRIARLRGMENLDDVTIAF